MLCEAQGLWCAGYGNGRVAVRLLQHICLDTPLMRANQPLAAEMALAAPAAFIRVSFDTARGQLSCSSTCFLRPAPSASVSWSDQNLDTLSLTPYSFALVLPYRLQDADCQVKLRPSAASSPAVSAGSHDNSD